MQFENQARVFFSAKSENESFARLFTAGFLMQMEFTLSEMSEIKTAVSEAVTNAILHGYNGKYGEVELFCAYNSEMIQIEVADKGTGIKDIAQAREPLYTSRPELERSGMGFTIMETFMDQVEIFSKVGHGTRIIMKKAYTER